METLTRRQIAEYVRPALAWGPRTPSDLLSYASAAGAPAPVTKLLDRLPYRRYRSIDELLADVPEVREF